MYCSRRARSWGKTPSTIETAVIVSRLTGKSWRASIASSAGFTRAAASLELLSSIRADVGLCIP
jgi:hypothetical protein